MNLSGRPNKFMVDDRFGKKIILLNKKKVCSSANTKSDKLFKEIITLNMLSLWEYKEAV